MNFDVKLFIKLKLITVACAMFYLASINAKQSYQVKNFTDQRVNPAGILTKLKNSANKVIAAYEQGKNTPNDQNAKQLEDAKAELNELVNQANFTPEISTITGVLDNRAKVFTELTLQSTPQPEALKKSNFITIIESAINNPAIKKATSPIQKQSTEDVFDEENIDILKTPKLQTNIPSADDEFEQDEKFFIKSKTLADQQAQKLAPVELRKPDKEDPDEPDSLRGYAFFPQEPVARPVKEKVVKPTELAEDPELSSEQPNDQLQDRRQAQKPKVQRIDTTPEFAQLRQEEVSLQEDFSRQPIPAKNKVIQKISTETPNQPDNLRIQKNPSRGPIIQNPPYKSVLKGLMAELNKPEEPHNESMKNEEESLLELIMDGKKQQPIVENQSRKQILIPPLKIPSTKTEEQSSAPVAPRKNVSFTLDSEPSKQEYNFSTKLTTKQSSQNQNNLSSPTSPLPVIKNPPRNRVFSNQTTTANPPNNATKTAQENLTTDQKNTGLAGLALKTRRIAEVLNAARTNSPEKQGRDISFAPKKR